MIFKSRREQVQPREAPVAAATGAMSCPLLSPFIRRAARVQRAPRVLLLGELCGANITYLCERGFRVSVETEVRIEGSLAGAIVWDVLSLIPPAEARACVKRLFDVLEEGGAVLTFFAALPAGTSRPRTRYRIISEDLVCPEIVQGRLGIPHPYQNRDIVRLFAGFDLDLLHTHKSGQREALFFKGLPASRPV